jgi:hypothetical protein
MAPDPPVPSVRGDEVPEAEQAASAPRARKQNRRGRIPIEDLEDWVMAAFAEVMEWGGRRT